MGIKFNAPKGTRDFPPGEMEIRDKIIKTIENVFHVYGYYVWDGPAFEHMETLTRKSGEEIAKEIYTFEDKAGRKLGLRFELTATIARIISNNPNLKKPVRGYSVGKVWRYENTQQGRYREFLQMDADIFGAGSVLCEVELLDLARKVLDNIGFENYYIQLNNRKVLESIVRCVGIDDSKKQDVFRAVDKLSKIGYDGVKNEFIARGLTEEDFEKVMKFMKLDGSNREKLEKMKQLLESDSKGVEGVEELVEILNYSEQIELDKKIVIDYTLIRGFDYYTGPIYEIKIADGEQVGSISGGGRYDKLIQLFGGQDTPAVGISFGIERIIDLISNDPILSQRYKNRPSSVLVAYADAALAKNAYTITTKIRNAGISADLDLSFRSFRKQIQYANDKDYSHIIIVGEDEIASGKFILKDMKSRDESAFSLEDIIKKLQ